MSGILRNTLRLVGTTKYAPINSTKYLRSMTLTTSRIDSSLLLESNPLHHHESERSRDTQAIQNSTSFWSTIRAAGKNLLLSIFDDGIKTLNIKGFTVSLDSGNIGLITPKIFFGRKDLIFPPTFSFELNEKSIEPKSNKIAVEEIKTFKLHNWYGSLDSEKLTLKLKNSNETFILKHTIHVKAHNNPPPYSEVDGVSFKPPKLDSDVKSYCAKIISQQAGSNPQTRTYLPIGNPMSVEKLLSYGHDVPDELVTKSNGQVTDCPDQYGKMKLKFPMTAVLEGSQQKIKIKDTDDYFIVYHNVEIQAYKEPAETITNSGSNTLSKNGIIRMQLSSGNLMIEEAGSSDQRIFIRQEVDIEIDLNKKIPSILIYPCVKRSMSID
ncbi:hypothetical protein HCN44_004466 [Aphidius gifuensis]|uniref:Uncharacterized protein n=1 Tax=Aphidius gifuensis TaxID=684658 RepID=A0A835CSH6_APHGI|nr:hypothetical protein HCN44_004466 [Aphidius gifuensis]